MSDANALLLGRAALGVYALLLIAGGLVGYLKAGSRPSLIAGGVSGVLALLALAQSFQSPVWAFREGVVLAVALALVFGMRLRKTGKFMPSGMLLAVSGVAGVLLAAASYNLRGG